MSKEVTLDMGHKYCAFMLETFLERSEIPETAKSTMKVEQEYSISMIGTKIIAHWLEPQQTIAEDRYKCYFYTPSTWWQHWKQDNAPAWFRNRYPVVKKRHIRTIRFTRYATYPLANVAIERDTHLFITTLGGKEVIRDEVREEVKDE